MNQRKLKTVWVERKGKVRMANRTREEPALWVTEDRLILLPVGRTKMTETLGKFVGSKRRGNLYVFLERGPRRPKISEAEGLCDKSKVWDSLQSPMCCSVVDGWFRGLTVPYKWMGFQGAPHCFHDSAWQWNEVFCTPESV